MRNSLTRRAVLTGATAAGSLAWMGRARAAVDPSGGRPPLEEFGYDQVRIDGTVQAQQQTNARTILMGLEEDSLLKPFRAMSGAAAPGTSIGGWYEWKPDFDFHHDDAGFAPGSTFGQWNSALARFYAASRFDGGPGDAALAERVKRLTAGLGNSISPEYFAKTRFPGYSLDKLLLGLVDAQRLAGDVHASDLLERVTDAALPSLPGHVIDREVQWKLGADISWMWDETYTMPENLYLASAAGGGARFRRMGDAYLDDATYFSRLARGENALGDKHAYSYVNSLCSAMQAYLTNGTVMHLQAARNGFDFLQAQSFATGGWGPDELLRKPGFAELAKSLVGTHNSFETPCGAYAHMKLTRYLLRCTRDGRYGDSMERVMWNTVMGALPMEADGRCFYYSDYNVMATRGYSVHRWPCCSGTLPQVVADYGINSYLSDEEGVWVNLYQPSELRWKAGNSVVAFRQTDSYPAEDTVQIHVTCSRPTALRVRLRIPGWAKEEAALRVNGQAVPLQMELGFAAVERIWKSGDTVELHLPMKLRLESLPANGGPAQTGTVALIRGPLVLFAIRSRDDSGALQIDRSALLNAQRTGRLEWTAKGATGAQLFVPFTQVGDRAYTTYVEAG